MTEEMVLTDDFGTGVIEVEQVDTFSIAASNPDVAGISSSIDDLKLFGKGIKAVIGDSIEDVVLERTIEGASTVTITIYDPFRELINSELVKQQFDVELDGLHFRFVQLKKQGKSVDLVFEEREISVLRKKKGARKIKRGKMTRAEFARMLVREVKKPHKIPFYSPDMHKRTILTTSTKARKDKAPAGVRREPGISSSEAHKITVKHVGASKTQVNNIEQVLDTGHSMHASKKVLISSIVTITQESTAENLTGGDRDSVGLFQQRPSQGWPASRDIPKDAHAYFKSAIAIEHHDPHISVGALCQAVQHSGDGSLYNQWVSEATNTVEIYLGGAGASSGSTSGAVDNHKGQYERKPSEDTWTCISRLAEEVKWRCFVVAGVVYFVSDTTLLRSKTRTTIDQETDGVDDIDFDYDLGKPITECTVTARTKNWKAPPGTVIVLENNGPANGTYLITSIKTSLFKPDADITLNTPTLPLDEPADEKKKKKGAKGDKGGNTAKVQKMIDEIARIDKLHLSYHWGGSHGSGKTPANGPFDCSSFVSHILQVGGFLDTTMTTVGLARWGRSGPGQEFTVRVRNTGSSDQQHTIIGVKDGGTWRWAGTSASNPGGGPGWISPDSGYLASLPVQRHAGGY
jgi:hypothetical protein